MLRAVFRMVLALLFAQLSVAAQETCEHFDVASARRMIEAKHVRELDDAFMAARRRDLPLIALYRSRRLSLNPTKAEELRYLRSLPKTRDELFCVYRLTYPRAISETPEVAEAVYNMFDRAAALAHENRLGYGDVLRLALWADGELGEVAWDWYAPALEGDPAMMSAAIRQLPLDDQRRLCGGSVRSFSAQDFVLRCQRDE